MKGMSGMLADAYAACLYSVSTCCAPAGDRPDRPGRESSEKQSPSVLRDQPASTPAPYYEYAGQGPVPWEPKAEAWSARRRDRVSGNVSEKRTSDGAVKRTQFSLRRRFRLRSRPDPRSAQISAPYNFRHLHGESFQFPQYTSLRDIPQPGPGQYRPIELSIHANTERSLSPLLPEFEMVTLPLAPPPPAQLPARRPDDFEEPLERSYSNMSFHIPRRNTAGSPATTHTESPPRIPPKSRARANTSPNIEQMRERIARGLNEMEALQREIEMVIERQSIYACSSRPSTAYSTGPFDLEPMPSIPALPPAAPSFSERLTPGGERPKTAPARQQLHTPPPPPPPHRRAVNGVGPAAAFITPPPSREREDRQPPPPLPLVLRPPLRKKKSFSRVSSWLFPGQQEEAEKHQRDASLDSVTNMPRPIKGGDGFYQCVARPGGGQERRSFDTDMTVSTWVTEDEQTAPTTNWSPGSTPATKTERLAAATAVAPLGRTAACVEERDAPRPRAPGVVGVAF